MFDAVRDLIGLLDELEIHYMLVGSFASTYYGPPRTTQDVDLVVELDRSALDRLLMALDRRRYYVAEGAAREAVRGHGQFNLVDLESGWKLDLIVRRDRPFSEAEFARRRSVSVGGLELVVASPEDTVLAKLEWAKLGGSERQVEDAASVLAVVGDQIDDDYLDSWAAALDVESELGQARAAAILEP